MDVGDQVYAVATLTRNLFRVGRVETKKGLGAVTRGKTIRD
jgi:hypothetical protein